MSRSCTLHFAVTKRKFGKRGEALLECVRGVNFLRFAENEGLEKLGASALRHTKVQYLIQQLIYKYKVEAQLRIVLIEKMPIANEAMKKDLVESAVLMAN
jgi:hypothetical protein